MKFHSGCRMPDGAASFFLKAFPYRPPLQRMPAVRPAPAADAAGERKQRLSPSMMKQIFLTAEGMLPGAGITAPCRPLKATVHASAGAAFRGALPQSDRSGPGQQVRKGQAGKNGFFHKFFTHHLNFQERMDWGKRRPSRTSSDP